MNPINYQSNRSPEEHARETHLEPFCHLLDITRLLLPVHFLAASLASARADRACNIMVVNANAGGPGSLRQAILDVSSGGTITFDPGLSGQTITLTTGRLMTGELMTDQLVIIKDLSIVGLGANKLTVSGNNASTVFYIYPVSVSIADPKISSGKDPHATGDAIELLSSNNSVETPELPQ